VPLLLGERGLVGHWCTSGRHGRATTSSASARNSGLSTSTSLVLNARQTHRTSEGPCTVRTRPQRRSAVPARSSSSPIGACSRQSTLAAAAALATGSCSSITSWSPSTASRRDTPDSGLPIADREDRLTRRVAPTCARSLSMPSGRSVRPEAAGRERTIGLLPERVPWLRGGQLRVEGLPARTTSPSRSRGSRQPSARRQTLRHW
jgi:hypothetical protein